MVPARSVSFICTGHAPVTRPQLNAHAYKARREEKKWLPAGLELTFLSTRPDLQMVSGTYSPSVKV